MRWRRGYRSRRVRDMRGASPPSGMRGMPVGLAGGGVGGIVVLLLLLFLGGNLFGGEGVPGIDGFQQAPPQGEAPPAGPDPEADLVSFVSFVFDDAQASWQRIFRESGKEYRFAEMVLFREATQSGCGYATSEVGPFYCGADETVYLDLGFFRELRDRFGAEGDFAQAYVIAHEVAHHVQLLLGISQRVQRLSGESPDEANELSIAQELQADCLAGVWGFTTSQRDLLQEGDVQEGLDAAAAIGDDRIQREIGGRVNPESWTHGSSEQRREWFQTGLRSGDADACDTFTVLT